MLSVHKSLALQNVQPMTFLALTPMSAYMGRALHAVEPGSKDGRLRVRRNRGPNVKETKVPVPARRLLLNLMNHYKS